MRSTRAAEVSIQAVSPESILAASWAMAHGAIRAMAAADNATPRRVVPDGRFLLAIEFPLFFGRSASNPGATDAPGGSTGNAPARSSPCPLSGRSLFFVQRETRLGSGA